MGKAFTDSFIKSLQPKDEAYKLSAPGIKGEGRLIVRVLPNGTKEFFFRSRVAGQDKTIALGRYGSGRKLRDITESFREKREIHLRTGDVKGHIQAEKRRAEMANRQGSFEQLLDAYVEALEASGKTSAKQVESLFKRHVKRPFPSLIKTKAKEVTADDITAILARMVGMKIKRQVNVLRAYLRAAFQHGAEAAHDPRMIAGNSVLFGLSANPVVTVKKVAEYERVGERVLTEPELRAFWNGLKALPDVQAATLRFNLALAGQRPKQLLRATWDEIDLDAKTLLLKDTKGRGGSRDHLVPLTQFALEQFKPLKQLNHHVVDGKKRLPFSADGKKAMVLETLSKAVREVSDKLHEARKIPKFQLRDLRRTCETLLQKQGVEKELRAHLLSHGRTTGVQGKHYERYDFLNEKRQALETWAENLQRIINPRKAKVIPLAKRRQKAA